MNTREIDNACERYRAHPVLGPATRLLAALRDLADAHSDGWCYWRAPARAARQLMALIEKPETATPATYRKAVAPIKALCTRRRLGLNFADFQPVEDVITVLQPVVTQRRRRELRQIARCLRDARLAAAATEDEVSICATVSRGFDLHPGEELTLAEASLVYRYLIHRS